MFYVTVQLIYDYVETDDNNDNDIDRTATSISRTGAILHLIPHSYGIRWTSLSFPSMPILGGRRVAFIQIGRFHGDSNSG